MENIMLQDEKTQWVKIIDFGLSNAYNEENPLKTLCGSPEYAAPELFVKGKKYGPEVDLWSLGVILYVMGTGRLPFTSPRDESSSADERRRRLMLQINRGLSAPQERLIVTLSDHYKNLLRLALMPVAHKRIRLGELRRHPWMFDASTNSNTADKLQLSLEERHAIVREISVLVSADCREVEMDIINRRFGNIGGIYNIMSHKVQLQKLRPSITEMNFVDTPQTFKHSFEKSSHESSKKIKVSGNFSTAKPDYLSNKSENKSVKEITRPTFIQNNMSNSRRGIGDLKSDLEKTKKKSGKSTMLPCPKKITHSISTQVPNNKIHATKEHTLQKQRKATVDSVKLVKFCHLQSKHKVDNTDDTRQRSTCVVKKYSSFRLGKNATVKKSNTSEPKSAIPKMHDRVKRRLLTKVNVSKEK